MLIVFLLLQCLPKNSAALENLNWNLYGTIGVARVADESLLNTTKVPYSTYTDDLSFDSLTKFGIKANFQATEKLGFTVQALTSSANDFDLDIEWSYLSFDASPNTKLRIGKMRRPLYHYSDSYSLGFSYNQIKPPSAVYYEMQELYGDLQAVDLYHRGVHDNWNYSLQAYFGRSSATENFLHENMKINTDNNAGLVFGFESNNFSGRLGYHIANYTIVSAGLTLAVDNLLTFGFPQLAADVDLQDRDAKFISLSGSYFLPGNWEIYGEYAELNSPDTALLSTRSAYAGLQYSFGQFVLHYSYGRQHGDTTRDLIAPIIQQADQLQDTAPEVAGGLNAIAAELDSFIGNQHIRRHNHNLGLRYDIAQTVSLKLEAESLTDRVLNDSTISYGLSLDFIY